MVFPVLALMLLSLLRGHIIVTFVCEDGEKVIRIELDAPGESFFNTLKRGTMKMGHNLT